MTSRERVLAAIDHREPDRVPLDIGATPVSGISVSTLSKLRLALGLDEPGDRVRVIEPYQMLGEVTDDLREVLGIDTVGIGGRDTLFGYPAEDWKPWDMPDGTPVLVPGGFNTEPEPNGDLLQYPGGDHSAPASGRMPAGGFYFDSIIRQEPIDDARLDPEDNLEEFQPITDDELARYSGLAADLDASDRAVVANFGGTGFGDIALVPAPFLKYPKGIRDVAEWYISTAARRDYVKTVFAKQCEIALRNLERIAGVVGDAVQIAMVTGTDFGTQRGPFASVESYRDLFKPFHRAVNDWIHANTGWRTFIHSCGGIRPLLDDFIEAGFDILNPVQ